MKLKSLTFMKESKMKRLMKVFGVAVLAGTLLVLPLPNSSAAAHWSANSRFTLARYHSNGSLDTAFGSNGQVLTSFIIPTFPTDCLGTNSPGAEAYAMAIVPQNLPDAGKIVVAGRAHVGSGHQIALARYNTDGSPDRYFGRCGTGQVLTNFPTSLDEGAYAVAIDASGRIVVAGYAYVSISEGDRYRFALARYDSEGRPDNSFGSSGQVITTFPSSTDASAEAIAIDASGRIVVAGSAWFEDNYRFALARYRSNGSLDTAFDTDGKVLTTFPSSRDAGANAIAITAGGKIVVAGYAMVDPDGKNRFALARYHSNGSLDITFDTDGKVLTTFPNSTDQVAEDLAIDANGRIVVAGLACVGGSCTQNGSRQFALARYHGYGSLDKSFDGDGRALTNFSGADEGASAIAIGASGRIVAAGWALVGGSNRQIALARYNSSNGSLDNYFGAGGKVLTNFPASKAEAAEALAIDASGRIVVAGWAEPDLDN